MSLEDWLRNRWLKPHQTSPEEVADLLSVADRDLRDAEVHGLSPDSRHNIAYSAALTCAKVALAASGYRPLTSSHHYYTIQSLPLTMGPNMASTRDHLDGARQKRSTSVYDRSGTISDAMANEVLRHSASKWRRGW
jgi:hypothetical protein